MVRRHSWHNVVVSPECLSMVLSCVCRYSDVEEEGIGELTRKNFPRSLKRIFKDKQEIP